MSAPTFPCSALAPPTKFLSVQDGTLCEFCRDEELIQPIRTRALSDLIESSRYCGLCAMWLRGLEHSRQNLKARGQVAALRLHPLEQDLDDVTLVFLSSPERPQIVWPHIGHMWAALDMIDIDDAKDINMKPLTRSDQAEATWKSIREWLDHCEMHHKDCKHKKTSAWKPTRLLYVCNTQATLQVHLVESQDIPGGVEYLTLSHCSGAESTLQLTRSSVEAFRASIPIDELSHVFIDACNTTKRLSHEYLWIDTLCIIQDDPADWYHEVGRMASTYGNSWLNLSADGDDAAGHGLFCPSDKRAARPWYPVYIHREWSESFPSNYCISEYHNWWERISDSKLNLGAWALQERLLAPRVLHLGLEQFALECSSNTVCERLPYGDPTIKHDTTVLTSLKKFVLDVRNGNLSRLTPENVFRNWNRIVQAYSQGQLTVATDKLVALSGLIDVLYPVFQHIVESEDQVEDGQGGYGTQTQLDLSCHKSPGLFLAGLWRPYAERQLVWRAMSRKYLFEYDGNSPSAPGKRYEEYIAPTWSWCSIKDAVIESQEARSMDIHFTKIIDTDIVPLDQATPFSGLRYCASAGSFLRLRCSYLPIAELGPLRGMKLKNFGAATREKAHDGEAIEVQSRNYWDVDFSQEAINCKSPIAVPVFANMAYFTNPVHCLVLDERAGENGNRWYIRIGAFVITHPEDVQRFWKGVDDFDHLMPEGCERHDGLYRFKELERSKSTYVRMTEVLQRIVEIR
ncbi:tol [Fusarium mundagurra]|uniref:Tol n=1 Tax=Fusarium mundagurra TaxID=1567541 RepID=A0A8H5YSA7_9HYPO|nr:tol [Fusarium mundagurra]